MAGTAAGTGGVADTQHASPTSAESSPDETTSPAPPEGNGAKSSSVVSSRPSNLASMVHAPEIG